MKKNITLLFAIAMLFSCCKTRHVTASKRDINTSEVLTNVIKKDSLSIDTGKICTETKTLSNVRDSATVTIIPDSGTVETVKINAGQNFMYTGKAKSIVLKTTVNNQTTIDEAVQENKGAITRSMLADSLTEQKQTNSQVKNKAVIASASYAWIIPLISVLALACVAAYLLHKFGVV